jgi:type IV fimbrial biogenesis protein FimT
MKLDVDTDFGRHTSPRLAGFTLLELIVTVAVGAILLTVGVPSMMQFIQNNRLKSESLALLSDVYFARSEAVKRKVPVLICHSSDPDAATPTCGGAWDSGWLVFASADGNTTYDAGDTLLRVHLPASEDVDVRSNALAAAALTFNPDGSTAQGGTARFAVCDTRGEDFGRQLNIAPVGQALIVKGHPGSPIADCSNPA